eukprot:179942-Amphidinium_carterae.1
MQQLAESRRWRLELEDKKCIGGLRHPWVSIRKLPGWREVGVKLRRLLQDVIGSDHVAVVDTLGTAEAVD